MASITTFTANPAVARTALGRKLPVGASAAFILGLPHVGVRGGRARCSSEYKAAVAGKISGASLAAVATSMAVASGPALALVDERMSTEGTGLSLGLSNNLLGWILLGVFGLIWSLFFVYTSTLEEDEESGLSL